ncbi:uncharacterized protein A1O5_02535 [Cladophialophora psammophila CBS 110553]|uniref:Major facilitator superfamily (MFS) profile domain-containing protein n=1 Tax=Cladophialophora psammophila CBS 110553 TaxID=1182543 RepID=W9XVF4_9EURO|nr:uncharacterized protein A1O5_02535 [Cladophialophora psammophila CBS 110553]EXJ74239.1 hypothetical protein A1O5_02535 [Cladophialophora psammophila CBS 110553]
MHVENSSAEVENKSQESRPDALIDPLDPLDPHDPLSWSTSRKLTILLVVGLWILLGTSNMIIIAPALQIIPVEFHSSFDTSTYLVGGPLLAYGVSSFLWVPLGNRYGIRLVFILGSLAAACMDCWAARTTSFGSLVAARTLASMFYAPPETLAPQLVGDVFHFKDRAKAMTWIGILQASGFSGGPLIGAFIIQNQALGWRWIEWILAIITFGAAVLMIFLLPETQYTRCRRETTTLTRSWKDELRFWPVSGGGPPKEHRSGGIQKPEVMSLLAYAYHSVAHGLATILPYFGHPVIILNTAFFSLTLLVTSYTLVFLLASGVAHKPNSRQTTQSITYLTVYPFSVGNSGLTFIAPLIGTWLAMLFCGVLADRLFTRLTRKEGRKPKPERRLPLLIVTGVVGIGGSLLFGICTQEKCHWVAPLFGSCFVSFCFISSLSISFAYLLDVYEAKMDTVMVIDNGMKNLAAFGISYAIVPWNTSAGYTVPFAVMAVILLVAHLLMALVYFKGEQMRKWSAQHFESARTTHHGDAF